MVAHEAAALGLTENALICGFELREYGPAREVRAADIVPALQAREGITWLHFNLTNKRAAQFLADSPLVPRGFKALLAERESRPLMQAVEDGLQVVMNDLSFDQTTDASEVATLWAFATPRLVISARSHPLRSADLLREELRHGLHVASGIELVAHMFDLRMHMLRKESDALADEVHEMEDRILSGDVSEQRERLGRVRRRCARIRRHFAHDRTALQKLVARPPAWISSVDGDQLRQVADELAFVLDDVGHLYERAKLLQEELAARVAEETGTRLYVLSILSAVLLPMTLITGVFGMNVAGLPWTEADSGFGWTMVLIVAAGGITLGLLRWRRLL
jgi:zinc transporter